MVSVSTGVDADPLARAISPFTDLAGFATERFAVKLLVGDMFDVAEGGV